MKGFLGWLALAIAALILLLLAGMFLVMTMVVMGSHLGISRPVLAGGVQFLVLFCAAGGCWTAWTYLRGRWPGVEQMTNGESRFKQLPKQLGMIAAGALFLAFVWSVSLKSSYEKRYNEAELKGLTMAEVEVRLGPPMRVVDEVVWIYQYGMDPDAAITFREGRADSVSAHKYD